MEHKLFSLSVRWAVTFLLGLLMLAMAKGPYGLSNYRQLLQVKENLKYSIDVLKIQNQEVRYQIQELKTSSRIRHKFLREMGFVEPYESVFILHPQSIHNATFK
jgi:hypothetical protein